MIYDDISCKVVSLPMCELQKKTKPEKPSETGKAEIFQIGSNLILESIALQVCICLFKLFHYIYFEFDKLV